MCQSVQAHMCMYELCGGQKTTSSIIHFSGVTRLDSVSHHLTSQVSHGGWPASPRTHLYPLPCSRIIFPRVLGIELRSLCLLWKHLTTGTFCLSHTKAFEKHLFFGMF